MNDQGDLTAALRGIARRLDNENAVLRNALECIARNATSAIEDADALDLEDDVASTLATILEHGSHAWRALEVAGLTEDHPDAEWPPRTERPVGSIAYHLAAMLGYTKQLYDRRERHG